MNRISRSLASLIISQAILAIANAEPATVIPANEAAAHIGEYATVEGVVARVFTSNKGNTFLNIGVEISHTVGYRRKTRQDHGPDRDVQGQAGKSNKMLPSSLKLSERLAPIMRTVPAFPLLTDLPGIVCSRCRLMLLTKASADGSDPRSRAGPSTRPDTTEYHHPRSDRS